MANGPQVSGEGTLEGAHPKSGAPSASSAGPDRSAMMPLAGGTCLLTAAKHASLLDLPSKALFAIVIDA
jgi:hypothetical protein